MAEFRWRLADDDGGQPALFAEEELVQRHLGRGEYAGLEFLHVNAKRIVTTVPPASRMPFRHTINAYRGCSHACVYCLEGRTRVLLADGRMREIGALVPGDVVVGTMRSGRDRRFVGTPVIDHWTTTRPAYRVVLEDGTELLASADHRFLTERGWKHVVGARHGIARRPHLTASNSLLGVGGFPEPRCETDEYRRGYLCGMIRGDGHLGRGRYLRDGRRRDASRFRLAPADMEPLARFRAYLTTVGVRADVFEFSAATAGCPPTSAVRPTREGVSAIEAVVARPTSPTEEWHRGLLAGAFDAEGSFGQVVRIADADPELLGWICASLSQFGFSWVLEPAQADGVRPVRLVGGLPAVVRFLLTVDPATTRKRSLLGRALEGSGGRRVVAVEPTGVDVPMFDITTGTGDFLAEGVVSHNCFARPTHEYLGLGLGRDFDTKLVVKVNAVERLRAELAAPGWTGEHIAMGTNTDPYQRCEAKYHLTRGIVKVLGDKENPFSVLTKSTLVLRDIDLLKRAAERTEVRVNFSIGTLDEEVWRATEPGTPHPRKRVEAVARLNEAGIACGVLVAPILPGLSDGDDQLREVVEACVGAGAVSVSAAALHLRAGVRDHYLGWLAGYRPDLLDDARTRFRGAYQPAAVQRALADKVRAMVADARRRWAPPTATPVVRRPDGNEAPAPTATANATAVPGPAAPPAGQLRLEFQAGRGRIRAKGAEGALPSAAPCTTSEGLPQCDEGRRSFWA
ncbi:MAG TPA: radical SAM protein [Acidimicrobiales bacterium]|nr:radical SAM protein [Acidimicrobiales bacterium]